MQLLVYMLFSMYRYAKFNVFHRQYSIRNIQYKVMCGVLDVLCMKYGAWAINHLKILTQQRYLHGLIA